MKKVILAIITTSLLTSCGYIDFEEVIFEKTLAYELTDLCEEDKACIKAVEAKTLDCMISSDWRKFLEDQDSEKEFNRFTESFYACLTDSEGNPYFEI